MIAVKQDFSFKDERFYFASPANGRISKTFTFKQIAEQMKTFKDLGIELEVCSPNAPAVEAL